MQSSHRSPSESSSRLSRSGEGNLAEAGTLLEQIAGEARSMADKHRVLVMLGHVRMKEQQYVTAADVFTQAAGIMDDAATLDAASTAYERAGNLPRQSNTAGVPPSNQSVDTWSHLGGLFGKQGDWPGAAASFEKAANLSSEPTQKTAVLRQLGFALTRAGDVRRAAKYFQGALTGAPGDPALHRALAETLMRLDRFQDAAAQFSRVVAIEDTAANRRALAVAQERSGQLDGAITTYTEMLDRLPIPSVEREESACLWRPSKKARTPLARRRLVVEGLGSSAGGHPGSSCCLPRRAGRWPAVGGSRGFSSGSWGTPNLPTPDRARSLEGLGDVSTRLGKDETAAIAFEQAIETGAATPATSENLGFVLYRLGRWRPALDAFLAASGSGNQHAALAGHREVLSEAGQAWTRDSLSGTGNPNRG